MKVQNYICVLLLGLMLSPLYTIAQDPATDLERVFQLYSKLDNISLSMQAYAFENQEDEKGQLTFEGTFKKRGENFYTHAWGREMIVKGKEMMVVNHEDKKIAIGISTGPPNLAATFPSFSIDSLQAQGGKLEYVGKKNGLRHYRIENPKSIIKVTDLYVNSSHVLIQMTYHYQEIDGVQPAYAKMDMYYRNVSFEAPSVTFFDPNKFYLKDQNGSLKPAPRYANYSLVEVDYDAYSQYQF